MIKFLFDNYKGFIKASIVFLMLVISFALGAGFQETRLTNYVYAACSPEGATQTGVTTTCYEDSACSASDCLVQTCDYVETCIGGNWAQTANVCSMSGCQGCPCAGGGGSGTDWQTVKIRVANCETAAPIEGVPIVIEDKEDEDVYVRWTDADGNIKLKWSIDIDHTYTVYPFGNAVSPNQTPPNSSRWGRTLNDTSSYNTVTEAMTPINSDAYNNQGAERVDDCAKECDFCFMPLKVGGRIVDKDSAGVGGVGVTIWTNTSDLDERKTYNLTTNADGWFQMEDQMECSDLAGWEYHVVPSELVDTTNSVAWNYNIDDNQPLGSDYYLFQDCNGTRKKHCAYSPPNLGCTFVTAPGPIGEITKITIDRDGEEFTISPIPVGGIITFLVDDEVTIRSTATAQDSDIVETGQYRRDFIPGDDWVGDCDAGPGNWCLELKNDSCSGATCKLKNTWTVTSDDLGYWWYVMNAFDEEGNAGKEKGRCSGNPNGAITPNPPVSGWSDCGNRSRIRIRVINPPTGTITADTEEPDSDGVVTASGATLRVLQNTTVWFTGTGTAYDGNSVDFVNFRTCTAPILSGNCKNGATSNPISPTPSCDESPCTLSHQFTVPGKYRVNLNVRDSASFWCVGYKNSVSPPIAWCDRPDHIADHVWVEVIPVHKISGNLGEIANAAACTGPIDTATFTDLVSNPVVTWTPDVVGDPLFPVRVKTASPTAYSMSGIGESDGWIKSTATRKSTLGGKWKLECVDIDSDGTWASYTGPTGNFMSLNTDRIVDFGYEYLTNPPWFAGLNGDIYGASINVFVAESPINFTGRIGSHTSSLFSELLFTETLNINGDIRITQDKKYIRNYTGNFWPEVLDLTPPDTVSALTDISNIDPSIVYTVSVANLNTMLSGGVYDLTASGVAVVYVTGGGTVKFTTTFLSSAADERILFVMQRPVTIDSSIGFDPLPFEPSPTDAAHIQAAILTGGNITYKANVLPDVPILVEGPVISGNGDLAGTPNINFSRDLKGANDFRPAVTVRYNLQILDIKQNSGLLISDVLWVVEDVELVPLL